MGDAVRSRDTVTGEAALIPLAGPANRQGRIAADSHLRAGLAATAPPRAPAIVKVFDLTAGMTGRHREDADPARPPVPKVYLHPTGHAGYYPGTHAMHLKLLFAPADGRLLGAQAVGDDGVDKRIDVLAVAIRAGMTVYDLEDLELAYAPPYGSAKDPVNMAGFVGANVLRGDVALWYAEEWPDLPSDAVLLDVRSAVENADWSIPGSILIPHKELRARLDEVPAGPAGVRVLPVGLPLVPRAAHPRAERLAGRPHARRRRAHLPCRPPGRQRGPRAVPGRHLRRGRAGRAPLIEGPLTLDDHEGMHGITPDAFNVALHIHVSNGTA